jgi:hypothetical protein
MKTKAFQDKNIVTQLASWSQLRHDTLLYVKQGYTAVDGCDYPSGFVDPRIKIWKAIRNLAVKTRGN